LSGGRRHATIADMSLLLPNFLFRTERVKRVDLVRSSLELQGAKERQWTERVHSVPIHKFEDYASYMLAGCKLVWATFRSCDLIATTVMGATYKIVTKDKDGKPGEDVSQPEINRFLVSPNPYDSWDEMLYMWTFHMRLTGNAYWLKDEVNQLGQPKYLYPLLPQFMRIIPDKKTKISKYVYHVNGTSIEFDPKEIIHFRRPHPSDFVFGMGDIAPSEALYKDYIGRKTLEEKFIEHGAMPSGIMARTLEEHEVEMDEADFGRLKAKWREEYEGPKNAGKTMFLQGKWTFNKLGLTHQEMQSLEKEKLAIEHIFMNHGVPLSVAGVREAANYATARQEEINFRKYTCVPMLNLLLGKMNQEGVMIQNFNPQWMLTYQMSGLIDVEQVWKDYGLFMTNGGMSRNELRELMGMEKHDDPLMDAIYMPQGFVPIEMAGMMPEPGAPFDEDGNPIEPEEEEEDAPPFGGNGDRKPPPKKKPPVKPPVARE
jgi:HK97 family phage portal protein